MATKSPSKSRPHRATRTGRVAAHGRPAAPARATTTSDTSAAPAEAEEDTVPSLLDLEEAPAATPAPKADVRLLKADSDDHLSTYFRDLAEHDLLGPEQERELAQGIEDQEILTWERLLSRADVVAEVVAMLEGKLETPVDTKKLLKSAESIRTSTAKKPDSRALNRLTAAAREVAEKLRTQDLDRTHIDVVIRELRRARMIATKTPAQVAFPAASAGFQTYLDGIDHAYRGSSQLREEFVKANLRLVVTMARRYDRGGMPLADLIQEGNLGLMHAVSRFDYRRGLRFSTYACWWIRHAIGRALADKARAVRIPVHMLEAQQQLEKVRQQLIRELGRQPTPQEVAKAARVPLAKLNQMHRYLMGQPLSLDRPVHEDDDRQLGELLADPASEDLNPAADLTTEALTKQVKSLMRGLSPIEADVLRQRFGLGDDEERTFREIGDRYRLSRERIRQIQNSALDKLKKALEREHTGLFEN
ncbi:MAG TPA: sigma-70 family RNA polymerase sigma factor [Kofleriaceae bacterium]|nr:sigma-70 family RNA polymerase sigma factor [Kofleriaceae bacterium]